MRIVLMNRDETPPVIEEFAVNPVDPDQFRQKFLRVVKMYQDRGIIVEDNPFGDPWAVYLYTRHKDRRTFIGILLLTT